MPNNSINITREEMQDTFLKVYPTAGTIKAASKAVGVHRTTVLGWFKRYPDFAEKFEQARREFVEELESIAYGLVKEMAANRDYKANSLTGKFMDWINGSVGAVMFFNTRSALLQSISMVNFINWSDNYIAKASLAFANQSQFWSDFMYLMISNFLKDRRAGLRVNISESEIADMARKGGVQGVINGLLKFGFLPTQIMDSFAIAMGGATFYRNRINSYKKQNMDQKAAEKQAFLDFQEIAEETSSQAGPIGLVCNKLAH